MKATTADAKKKYGYENYKEIAAASIRKMLLENNDLTPMQKKTLDRELIIAGDSADYTSQDAFDISQYVRESRQDDAAEHRLSGCGRKYTATVCQHELCLDRKSVV